MVKVSIQIAAKDTDNKTVTDKISYVNPQATDEQLVQFAQQLEALTTNSYAGTTKITEEAIG